jgi:putative FmdB family regulatory protein
MATYDFACGDHGVFTVAVAMTALTPTTACPSCGATSRRVFTAPGLALGSATARRLLEATARTAHEPRVVPAPSGRRRTPVRPGVAADPRTAHLPAP